MPHATATCPLDTHGGGKPADSDVSLEPNCVSFTNRKWFLCGGNIHRIFQECTYWVNQTRGPVVLSGTSPRAVQHFRNHVTGSWDLCHQTCTPVTVCTWKCHSPSERAHEGKQLTNLKQLPRWQCPAMSEMKHYMCLILSGFLDVSPSHWHDSISLMALGTVSIRGLHSRAVMWHRKCFSWRMGSWVCGAEDRCSAGRIPGWPAVGDRGEDTRGSPREGDPPPQSPSLKPAPCESGASTGLASSPSKAQSPKVKVPCAPSVHAFSSTV